MYVGYFLERNATIYHNKIALKCGHRNLTFSELKNHALQLAKALFNISSLSKGDRVAFLDYNSIEYIAFHLGLPISGLIAVPLNFRLVGKELKAIINSASCKAFLYRSYFATVVEEIREELTSVKHFICLDGPRGEDIGYEELLAKGRAENFSPPGEDDPAYILYTSGTTGIPKGATLTHRNMLSAMRGNIIGQEMVPENIFLLVAPLFHIAPLQILLAFLYRGCTCVLTPQFDPQVTMELAQRERITNIFLVPRMLNVIVNHPELSRYDLSCLSTIAYGGAPTPPEVLRKFLDKWGSIFLQVYGASEAGLITVLRKHEHMINDKDGQPKYLNSCGREIIDVQIKVINNEGSEVNPGEVGEILVKSESVMQGYWQLPEETSECIKDGWFHTGDMGILNEDRYLFHIDRKKHMIISGGENIYPAEVENVLHMMPGILEAAVIGVPDEKWGETVKAVVVLKEGHSLNEREVIEFCKMNLAGYKKPTSVDFVQELPRNAAGKVLKGVLRERYLKNSKKKS
jgi:acyl-CoA synthetase (AMP-forming)/AMP-acid ligase II